MQIMRGILAAFNTSLQNKSSQEGLRQWLDPASEHDGRADCCNKQNMELWCFLHVDTAGVRMWGRHERMPLPASRETELPRDYCAGIVIVFFFFCG